MPGKDSGPPANCDLCGAAMRSTTALLNHKRVVHNVLISCNLCRKVFKTAYLLKYHLKKHDTESYRFKWHCKECSIIFPTRKELHVHFVEIHKSCHGCERCGKIYSSMQSLREHLMGECEHALQCDTCGHKTMSKQSMKTHQIRHFKIEDLHICKFCSKKFLMRDNLKKHLEFHLGDEDDQMKFTCEACGKRYAKYGSFQKHRMLFHPEIFRRTIYRCSSCQFVTKSLETFERHKKNHSIAKHVCDICEKSLSCATALRIHRNIHTGEKPYSCEICGKTFSSPNYLRKHNRVHTPTLRCIRCRNCNQNFTDASYKNHSDICLLGIDINSERNGH